MVKHQKRELAHAHTHTYTYPHPYHIFKREHTDIGKRVLDLETEYLGL